MDNPTHPTGDGTTAVQSRWHVNLGDETQGPLALAEVERFWDQGRLTRDSMVWAEGMSDWRPLGQVPELVYLEARSRARSTRDARRTHEAAPTLETVASPGADLAALVHDELDAAAPKKAADAVPEGMPALSPTPEWQPPPMTVTFWQKLAPKSRRGLKPIHLIFAIVGAATVTGAVVIGALILFRQSTPPAPHGAPSVAVLPAATATPVAAAEPAKPPPTAVAPAPETSPSVATKSKAASSAKVGGVKTKAQQHQAPERVTTTGEDRSEREEPPATPATGRALTAEDIKAGVKQGMSAVMECIKNARQAGELVPGTHTLILEWTITPSGTVNNPRVRGPAAVLNTSLPACFGGGMRAWRFPASPAGAPVKNFPFGPFTLK